MAKAKVLALIDKDEVLLEHCKVIEQSREHFHEKMEFIKKQAETAHEERKKADEPHWEVIKDRLKETGALDNYNPKTHHLSFSIESNAIELIEHDDDDGHPLARLFSRLF